MASLEKAAEKLDFHGMIIASMSTALAFVAGLFWRDAINQTIDEIIPAGQGLLYSYAVAFGVTLGIGVVIFILVRSKDVTNRLKQKALEKATAGKKPEKAKTRKGK